MNPTRLPLINTVAPGVNQCPDQASLLASLSAGGKQILAGQALSELGALLPLPHPDDVLHVVAESRLLYGDRLASALAETLGLRVRLAEETKPKLRLALAELLQNAIEHGNLGLGQARRRHGASLDSFTEYLAALERTLAGPLGRIPVRLSCRTQGEFLQIEIEDRGLGFKVRHVVAERRANPNATGQGIGLLFKVLEGNLHYDAGGRVVRFSLPLAAAPQAKAAPNLRATASVLVLCAQPSRQPLLERLLRQAGVTRLQCVSSKRELLELAGSFQLHLLDGDAANFANLAYTVADLQGAHPGTPLLLVASRSGQTLTNLALSYPHVDVWHSLENLEGLALRLERLLQQQAHADANRHLQTQQRAEIERTRVVQQEMLPTASSLSALAAQHGVQLATSYVGCETLAGDYWTVAHAGPNQLALGVMDFTGHGLRAAMNTVQLHALLKTEWHLSNPQEIAGHLNQHLHKLLGPGCFAAYVYAVLNTQTGALHYCAGGAPPLLLKQRNGTVLELPGNGLPLGLHSGLQPTLQTALLQPGETLLMVSDALTDASHRNGQRWGTAGLSEAWRAIPPTMPARASLDALLKHFHKTAVHPIPDDLTAIIVKRP